MTSPDNIRSNLTLADFVDSLWAKSKVFKCDNFADAEATFVTKYDCELDFLKVADSTQLILDNATRHRLMIFALNRVELRNSELEITILTHQEQT